MTEPSDSRKRLRSSLGVMAQTVAFLAAAWFLVDTARDSWGSVARADVVPAALPLVLASVIVMGTYLFLILTWSSILPWWGERLAARTALRMFTVSNLARFIPGMVWQFAGLAAMARARNVSPVAVTSAVLLHQLLTVATGFLITLATLRALPALSGGPFTPVTLVLAAAVIFAGIGALSVSAPFLERVTRRLVRVPLAWPRPSAVDLGRVTVRLTLGWVGYGVAFWLFCRSFLGPQSPSLLTAGASFVASYVAGLLAVFAPGGIVVREAALVAILSRAVGGENALLLALSSRVWLVGLELLTTAGVVGVQRWWTDA